MRTDYSLKFDGLTYSIEIHTHRSQWANNHSAYCLKASLINGYKLARADTILFPRSYMFLQLAIIKN